MNTNYYNNDNDNDNDNERQEQAAGCLYGTIVMVFCIGAAIGILIGMNII